MEPLKTYNEIMQHLKAQRRKTHLLLGNGFSIAYSPTIFSYNSLNNFIQESTSDLIKRLFQIVNTKNFETVMQQMGNFCEIAEEFGEDPNLVRKIKEASSELKTQLLSAIKSLHPEHVFTVEQEKSARCYRFLNSFIANEGSVFSTNYDLLLYWVFMRNESKLFVDGFGRDKLSDQYVPAEEADYSELRWGKNKKGQNVHYIHGALHLFDDGIDIVKEEYTPGTPILERIKQRIDNQEYPIFVTAGSASEKLQHIMHNKYLSTCYESLCQISGSLITFGFNFGEFDDHIIDAINAAHKFRPDSNEKLYSVYIGVYSEADQDHILKIQRKFKCKVNVFDAKTVPIWEEKES